MPLLIETFKLDLTTAGMLMSVFAITGLILAIPAGFILQRFGPKAAGVAALGFLALGSTLGALAGAAAVLLLSRLIEGMGMGIIAVVGPAAIAMWFPLEKRGMAMGLWSTWVPAGSIIMFNSAPALATSLGWQAVWWMSTAFTLAALALFWLMFRAPVAHELAPGSALATATPAQPANLGRAMANRHIWLLSLEFMCFNLVTLAWGTFYPTYLNAERGYTLASASFTTSLIMIATLLAAPLGGWLSDRIGSRKRVIVIPFFATTVTLLFLFTRVGLAHPRADDPDRAGLGGDSDGNLRLSARSDGRSPVRRHRHGCACSGPERRHVHRAGHVRQADRDDELGGGRLLADPGMRGGDLRCVVGQGALKCSRASCPAPIYFEWLAGALLWSGSDGRLCISMGDKRQRLIEKESADCR